MNAPLPAIHLVTGYLGSGKTTFLCRLLEKNILTERVAVIVNDFGGVVYDEVLLRSVAVRVGVEILDVPGGCLCCSAVEDFKLALREALERGCERVFIEATGLADAAQVRADLAYMGFPVESTLCVLDALNAAALRQYAATVDEQLSVADVVLIAKADLASREQLAAVHALARSANERAVIAYLQNGSVPADFLAVVFAPPQHFTSTAHTRQEHLGEHLLRDEIAAVRVVLKPFVEAHALEQALALLPPNVIRTKGLVRVVETEEVADETTTALSLASCVMLVNGVCSRWELHRLTVDGDQQTPSELVCVGRRIEASVIAACFEGIAETVESGTLRGRGFVEHHH